MLKILKSSLLIITGLIAFTACNKTSKKPFVSYVCPANRFTNETFTLNTYTVAYTQSTDYTGKLVTLNMDINIPAADTLALRPLIIYCHGGGFTSGARTNAWPVKFCKSFAKRGYVTASIDYRLGIGPLGDADVINAQLRAVQDAKAAVRFFKKTAIEQGNPYRIDTAQIFISGESSGAIIALQMAYLNSRIEFADLTNVDQLDNVGGIEGPPATPQYSSNIKGIIGLDGAILDLNWINNAIINVPVIMVHGSKDAAIPYKQAIVNPFTATTIYGSYFIDSAARSQNIPSALYTFKGAGTAPFISSTKYADSTINYVSQQLYGLIDCQKLGQH